MRSSARFSPLRTPSTSVVSLEHSERCDEHHAELGKIPVDFRGVASHRIGIGRGLSAGWPDLKLDDT
jgi:hypothetical protein